MSTRERKRPGLLPDHVSEVQKKLSKLPAHELKPIGIKLIGSSPDLVRMWNKLLERGMLTQGGYHDDLWVWAFLEEAEVASRLPPLEMLSQKRKQSLAVEISDLASKFTRLLTEHGLDAHLVYVADKQNDGFWLYENATDRARLSIDKSPKQKLSVATGALPMIAEYCQEVIAAARGPGNAVKNAAAVRFARLMAIGNHDRLGDPLTAVVAAATNALYETDYSASDIMNLLTR